MFVTAVCCCGKTFSLAEGESPRQLRCHFCGSRAVVTSPTELANGVGWQPVTTTPVSSPPHLLNSSGVLCSLCRNAAAGACSNCGKFFCGGHGRKRHLGGATCKFCYDARRPWMAFAAYSFIGVAAVLFALILVRGSYFLHHGSSVIPTLFGLWAAFMLAGMVLLWKARRRFP